MKKVTSLKKGMVSLLVLVAATLVSSTSYGQVNAVKTNLANLAISGGSIHYERVVGDATTAQLGVFMSAISVDETKFSGFGLIPQYRFYPGKNAAPHGFFVAPLVSYQVFSLETTVSGNQNAEADYSLIGAGLDIGKQWLINRAFSIELSLGATFNSADLTVKTSGVNENQFSTGSIGSTAPRFGLSMGYAF